MSEEDTARHIDGVMALISHRGPQAFQTDFEKALLKSQVALVVSYMIKNLLTLISNHKSSCP